MTQIKDAKATMRREVQARLDALDAADRRRRSLAICQRVETLECWQRQGLTMLYMPFGAEVDVGPLALSRLAQGRGVCVPVFEVATRRMWAVELAGWTPDLWPRGRMGVPVAPPGRTVGVEEIGVIIAPGVAFDAAGNRLGRGMGFYDRFLSDPAMKAAVVGVAFEEQVVGSVPRESTDAPLHAVVTEQRALLANPQRPRG
jgi:5-formyltetrahydrofolate cyclo-ligase